MFDNLVAGVLTVVLDDQTDRDVITLASELVSPDGKLTLLHLHLVTAKPARDSRALVDAAKGRQALQRLTVLADELSVDAEARCVKAHLPRRGLHEFASRRGADLLYRGGASRSAGRGGEQAGAQVIIDLDKLLVGRPRPPLHPLNRVTGHSFPPGTPAKPPLCARC